MGPIPCIFNKFPGNADVIGLKICGVAQYESKEYIGRLENDTDKCGWTSTNLVKYTDVNESNMSENYVEGQVRMLATQETSLFLSLLTISEVFSVCS